MYRLAVLWPCISFAKFHEQQHFINLFAFFSLLCTHSCPIRIALFSTYFHTCSKCLGLTINVNRNRCSLNISHCYYIFYLFSWKIPYRTTVDCSIFVNNIELPFTFYNVNFPRTLLILPRVYLNKQNIKCLQKSFNFPRNVVFVPNTFAMMLFKDSIYDLQRPNKTMKQIILMVSNNITFKVNKMKF